jgi:hypothetical protein
MTSLPRVDKTVPVMESTRRLWMSVLLQAFQDLEEEELGSYWHSQSMAFFFGSGDWVQSRRDVCDYLGLEPSDIRRPALRIVNRRRLTHGLPPLQTQAPRPEGPRLPKQRVSLPAARPEPPPAWPRLEATFNEPPKRKRRGGTPGKRWAHNPFDPFRPLPSELKKAV